MQAGKYWQEPLVRQAAAVVEYGWRGALAAWCKMPRQEQTGAVAESVCPEALAFVEAGGSGLLGVQASRCLFPLPRVIVEGA